VSAGALRAVLRLVAAAGIPGIIVGSIAENDGVAITFGAITAIAAFGLIVATAAAPRPDLDTIGTAVEERVAALVADGADENEVRALVAEAVRLGQQQQNS
jgi:hypothetical protein